MAEPRPKIVFHARVKHVNRLIQVYKELGAEVDRGLYSKTEVVEPGAAHVIWGMAWRPQWYRHITAMPNVFVMENGWFTQKSGGYIDKQGSNAMSSIRGATAKTEVTDAMRTKVAEYVDNLHTNKVKVQPVVSDRPYIFIPLQVEKDSQILFFSKCKSRHPHRQSWWVRHVCEAFPDHRLVFRPHPKDQELITRIGRLPEFKCHKDAEITTAGKSYDWIPNAEAVLGINSTVLLEALTFRKRVFALGEGLFSENGAMLEAAGNVHRLPEILDYEPNQDRITALLDLLIDRQIPYGLRKHDAHRYDVFMQVLDAAKEQMSQKRTVVTMPSKMPEQLDLDVPAGEKIYGYASTEDVHSFDMSILDNLVDQGAHGLYFINLAVEPETAKVAQWCREHDMDFILGLTTRYPNQPDHKKIARAMAITNRLAIGNTRLAEFMGPAKLPLAFRAMADKFGFEWICPITHKTVCWDIHDGARRDNLGDTECVCLCGYVLAGYVYGDPRMPHQGPETTLGGRDLNDEFGLTHKLLQDYLGPMNIMTGAGFQDGLSCGIRPYAKELGFKGIVSGMPFDLAGTEDVAINRPLDVYPTACGDFKSGYQQEGGAK